MHPGPFRLFRLAVLVLVLTGCRAAPPPPNIIFVMTDDHAVQAMGAYGSRINTTPNLDRIAQAGVRFDHAYCTNSICAPARATVLTGKFSHKAGVISNLQAFDNTTQATLPVLMQEAGYRTALVGKWHLKAEPVGFDYWKVLRGQGRYYHPLFIEMGQEQPHEGYTTNLITDAALAWIRGQDRAQPFFLMLHHKAPHRNWMPDTTHLGLYAGETVPEPPTLFDDYRTRSAAAREQKLHIDDLYLGYDLKLIADTAAARQGSWIEQYLPQRLDAFKPDERAAWDRAYAEEMAAYLADPPEGAALTRWKYQRYIKDYLRTVASVDDNMGRLLDFLAAEGLAENTLVIYTSDQGFYLGEHGWFDKRFMYESSYRIPLVMQWPAAVAAGRTVAAPVMNVDLAPTILDVAGAAVPDAMQGVSLKPLLTGRRPPDDWRTATYYHYYEYPAEHDVRRHYGVRTDRYKLIHFYHDIDAWELYDLEADPEEVDNVYGRPAYADVQAALHETLTRLQAQYDDRPEAFTSHLAPDRLDHRAVGRPTVLAHPPEDAFSQDLETSLTDGARWTYHLYTAMEMDDWLGFRDEPFEATVDLGATVPITSVGINVFQHRFQQAYFPVEVTVAVSDDGRVFEPVGTLRPAPSEEEHGTRMIEVGGLDRQARFVRVQATGVASIPAGRPGGGDPALVLVDEMVVR